MDNDNATKIEDSKFDCANGVPYFFPFIHSLGGTKSFILIVPMIVCVAILWNFSKCLRNLISCCPPNIRPNCISLISIYPIVSVSSVIAIAVPRAYFFMDTIGHVAFMIISYQLYRLLMIYIDGESNFISFSTKESFTLKTPPLCCCCPFGRSQMTKQKFNFLRFLILQMPITHIAMFLILNMIFIEDSDTFDRVILYFIPFIALTVLGGIWGFNLSIRLIAPFHSNLKLPQKYFAFQLVLFFCKIQPILLNVVMKMFMNSCEFPFSIVVKRHIIIQIIVQFEMLMLSTWAKSLHKNPAACK